MFSLSFQVLSDDPLKLRYLTQSINNIFKDICEPVKVGASYICAPSQNTLILLYFNSQSIRDMNVHLEIISNDAMYITKTIQEINNRFRSQGFYITLLETSRTSL
ncbi:hypothetical protein BFU36_01955 [Sulfolobus sp. A20]|nr:hypothetical protein BFU36_01955 [Sulfolobus sp. A20]TRM78257.1 hypothetical protein DJ532_01530 [Sulfolobus sp. A20-N-F8]TRM78923.1 hypothetical protein DJ528_03520 [Sulfolobus sp. B5]TRM80797.1 hypothetical protein DJ531_11815 [Sulfolobus sp. A20-N-F6]TRM85446.1 hypothetical protein DJ522_00690 [Sulfolobus sp. F3]TRM88498.1 hypothetical protein DJ529_05115 [Sulfolobus sp. C3]TRM91998.1 hypothetical protein DJ526_06465 [Sulfolobus sp. A20-N-G8]TRM98010.1 hypothetical protein DMP16_00685 